MEQSASVNENRSNDAMLIDILIRIAPMKFLFLHCQDFSYKTDHPTPVAEESKSGTGQHVTNAGILFLTVEAGDSEASVNAAAKEARKLARKAGAETLLINSFAHLSTNLAPPEEAQKLSALFAERLTATWEGTTITTPFGWYKSFHMNVLGHADSQVFREF